MVSSKATTPDQPVEVEEPADLERAGRPVPQRREVGDGEVVDVHRLVVALVAGRVVAERLEDRLVDASTTRQADDRRERVERDEERQQQPPPDHGHEQPLHDGEHGAPRPGVTRTGGQVWSASPPGRLAP